MKKLDGVLIGPDETLHEALRRVDLGGEGIVLVVDPGRKLLGTITDGDLRRATLTGMDMDTVKVESLVNKREPITAPVAASAAELMKLMKKHGVRHIPLLDGEGRVEELALLRELALEDELPLTAVVMAGGFGTRMRPLTESVPKPMLPVGDRPVMEHVLEQLQKVGISHISITTHYKPEAIIEHFGDGRRFGVEIDYVNEAEPLGTAGALGMLKAPTGPLLVINGDVLTQVNFRSMLSYHVDNHADMTVGVRRFELQVPYGVVEMDESHVTRLDEKPTYRFFINAGVYLIEPVVLTHIKRPERLDATELIDRLIDADKKVVGFPIHEYWLDIGRPDDYARANKEWTDG
ncbi:MAG TPA: nucleotidyltransferase family protein [Candidatus Dormibacteraeota bacterium]|nr:nucleotidyltransferase family protein [Candidatus Dormibacteraeota bacterium]